MEENFVKFVCDWNLKDIDVFKKRLQSVIDCYFSCSPVGDGKDTYDSEKTTLYDLVGYVSIGNEVVPFSFDSHIFAKGGDFSDLQLKKYFDYVYNVLMHFRKYDLEGAKSLDFSYIAVLSSYKCSKELSPHSLNFGLIGIYDVSVRFEKPRISIEKK